MQHGNRHVGLYVWGEADASQIPTGNLMALASATTMQAGTTLRCRIALVIGHCACVVGHYVGHCAGYFGTHGLGVSVLSKRT